MIYRALLIAALALFTTGVQECTPLEDADGDGYTNVDDCDDTNADIHPDAPELCDGLDNDCDEAIDDEDTDVVDPETYYPDYDGDGYGQTQGAVEACVAPEGYAAESGDCDDSNQASYPGAEEVCDGGDNNCDGQTDEGLLTSYYYDADGDGYGDTESLLEACDAPNTFFTTQDGDCNDLDASIHPEADEFCDIEGADPVDSNCDGLGDVGALDATAYYLDEDLDGFGDSASEVYSCEPLEDRITQSEDCDDGDPNINPQALEVCDGADNNCDGLIDDEGSADAVAYYPDEDGDGFGADAGQVNACVAPDGYVPTGGDCDDLDLAIHPEAMETCDGIDEDCDGQTDEGVTTVFYADNDGDSFGVDGNTLELCEPAAPHTATRGGDCDDGVATTYPGAPETCNGADDDCDGSTDEGLTTRYYQDEDNDSWGTSAYRDLCTAVDPYDATRAGDCDDSRSSVNPGASEQCNGLDDDCDGSTDEGLTTRYYQDGDNDSWGTSAYRDLCTGADPYDATRAGDCDDTRPSVNPGASEQCNGLDDDCDGSTDEGVKTRYYRDSDGDGWGVSSSYSDLCGASSPYTSTKTGDCNDSANYIYPNAAEYCDGADYNCDGDNTDAGLVSIGWGNYSSIQAAVNAGSNHMISVCSGSYGGFDIVSKDNITIEGFTGTVYVTGSGSSGAYLDDAGGIVFNNLHIDGNNSEGGGGIRLVNGSSLTVNGSTVNDNETWGHGGGIYCNQSTLHVYNSQINSNYIPSGSGNKGGGLYARGNCQADLHNTQIKYNGQGAGVYIRDDDNGQSVVVTLDSVTFKDNYNYDVKFWSGKTYTWNTTVSKTCKASTGKCQ